ncbi:MAG: NUDIX domain-containing protein [Bacillota bacterium]
MGHIRVSVKAIIIRDGSILLTKNRDQHGVFYLLPGGGQNPGETVADALRRECLEELGARVEPGPLLFVRDYLSENHEFAGEGEDVHQVELMFAAVPQGEPAAHAASSPDSWQTGVEWVPLNDLGNCRLYPAVLKALLAEPLPEGALYMGDVN